MALFRHTATAAIITIVAVAFCACGDADSEYSNEACYFVFDNSIHQDATLASSMNPLAPGVFCRITETTTSGVLTFSFANNQGLASSAVANAQDLRRSRKLGQQRGIIVGYGNGDITNPVFYAYDNQCPNCITTSGLQNYQLSMSDNGIATCNKCKCSYDMNNGGYMTEGGEEYASRLVRYRAGTTGTFGVLSVSN